MIYNLRKVFFYFTIGVFSALMPHMCLAETTPKTPEKQDGLLITLKLNKDAVSTRTLNPANNGDTIIPTIDYAANVITQRLTSVGIADFKVTRSGENLIVVFFSKINDGTAFKSLLSTPGHFSFRTVFEGKTQSDDESEMLEGLHNAPAMLSVSKTIEIDGQRVKTAHTTVTNESDSYTVSFELDDEGARLFAILSRKNTGKRIAIVLDNKILTAPHIMEPITGGRGQISGGKDLHSMKLMSALICCGALPPLNIIEERAIKASGLE